MHWSAERCHLPVQNVAYPYSFNISAIVAYSGLICPSMLLSQPVRISTRLAHPAVWWLAPVSSEVLVAEHTAVVWKLLYLNPSSARRSILGVSIFEP